MNRFNAYILALFIGFAQILTPSIVLAQVSGGVISVGPVTANHGATFKSKSQIQDSGGVPVNAGASAGGDLSGTYPNPSVAKIQGNAVANTNPLNTQCLVYAGTFPTGTWGPGSCAGGATGPTSIQVTVGTGLTVTPGTPCITGVCAYAVGIDNTAQIISYNGRFGSVVPASGDYSVGQVTGAAPLASPTFTGTPAAPTPSTADNSTKLATTAYVQNQLYLTAALASSTYLTSANAAATYLTIANAASTYETQTAAALLAPLASPALTGTPTVPTAAAGTDTTQIASTAFVQTAVPVTKPDGRFTLTSGVPITITDVTGAGVVYYDGVNVPIWNSTTSTFNNIPISGELSVTLGSNWLSGSAYDWYIGLNAGTPMLCSGPAWTNAGAGTSARGTGAGTTQQSIKNTISVNTNSMTCNTSNTTSFTCPAFGCTLVASTLMTGAGTTEDSAAKRYTFNQYNAQPRSMVRVESTASWTWSTASFHQVNASAANQLSYFAGNTGSPLNAYALCIPLNSSATLVIVYCGIGNNSTSVNSRILSNFSRIGDGTVVTGNLYATYDGYAQLGLNNLVWLEQGAGSATQTWFGVSSGLYQTGITGSINQ